jgi:hypothetical protein
MDKEGFFNGRGNTAGKPTNRKTTGNTSGQQKPTAQKQPRTKISTDKYEHPNIFQGINNRRPSILPYPLQVIISRGALFVFSSFSTNHKKSTVSDPDH